ncbi:unnamed protein product [Rhizophagus irregularis]|uniref:Galactose oxidase n=1 Tax=Rhizophagus irregularis TaxID=588596 RepID=A0A2I1GP63_9GLOM|nr:hypothetical protein RhiirA4_445340 [Rhizophagus irregularis]CAB4446276.1 unnamed protein product [Rhizophagus irregularis]CAB4446305.1 unnamed protein product [Rhizophagus irregularis]
MKNFTLFLITLLCLFQIINAQLSPNVRKLFSTVHIEKKLYVYGGFMDNENANAQKTPDDRFFYLDVSIPFDTSNLPWRTIPDNAKNLPLESLSSIFTGGSAASIGGVNNETIYLFNNENDNKTSILSYNSQSNIWNTQNFSGVKPIGRNQITAVTDYTGKIYLLTGFDIIAQGVKRTNGLFICDTINSNCVIKDAPLSRLGYGVTLLPNGNLVYMGGSDKTFAPISDNFKLIYIYDTINDRWDSKITIGNFPPSDAGVTTVLGLNGDKIILFGGVNGDDNNLYVLNLANFEWYVPKTRGKGPVFKRGQHCANVIGKYMVLTFGSNGVTEVKYRSSGESDVLLLDISNDSEYVWTTSFDPTSLVTTNSTSSVPLPSNSSGSKNDLAIKIGISVGLIVLIIIILIVIFLFIRRRKNEQSAIPTPGNAYYDKRKNAKMVIPTPGSIHYDKTNI